MPSWTNATEHLTPAGVILHRRRLEHRVRRLLASPGPELAPIVERYWSLYWEGATVVPSSLIPQFSVNLTREVGSGRPGSDAPAVLTGVPTRRFDVELMGTGEVLGVKLHPGALTAITGTPASALTDRTVPAAELLPAAVVDAFVAAASTAAGAQVDAVESALAPLVPATVPAGFPRTRTVLELAKDPEITRVEQLADRSGLGIRALQRLFDRWIGLSPKQVIVRLRLHDAAAALDDGSGETLADLAIRLGFFDQAHFTREFARFVGVTPARFAAEGRSDADRPRPYAGSRHDDGQV